jgi:hypothetical protein
MDLEKLKAELAAATKAADAAQLSTADAEELELRRQIASQKDREARAKEDAIGLLTDRLLDEAKAKYPGKLLGAVYVEGPGDGVFIVCSASKKSYDHMVKLIEQKKATSTDTRNFALENLLYPDPKENNVHEMMDAFPRLADTLANEALDLSGAKATERSKRR